MSNEEILKKAIKKAEKNGYKLPERSWFWIDEGVLTIDREGAGISAVETDLYQAAIFSHDFAKAFWNDGTTRIVKVWDEEHDDWDDDILPSWSYHLTEMVQYAEPLQYLSKFL